MKIALHPRLYCFREATARSEGVVLDDEARGPSCECLNLSGCIMASNGIIHIYGAYIFIFLY